MNLECTREWAKDKDGASSYIAIILGMIPSAIQGLCKYLTEQNVHTTLSRSDIETWTGLYKKHRLVYRALYRDLQKEDNSWIVLQSKPARLLLRTICAGTPEQRKRLLRTWETIAEGDAGRYIEDISAAMSAWLEELAQDKPTTNTTLESWPLELVFYVKIYVFCWLEYKEHFTTIYRKARQGDFDAIEKLLRIDPLVLRDRFILENYTTAPRSVSHKLQVACNNPRKDFLKISHIKSSFCGFISAFFEHVGQQPLTPVQIRELFDSLARDREREPGDEDLPDEYDAFRKAVKRYHRLWLPMLKTSFNRPS